MCMWVFFSCLTTLGWVMPLEIVKIVTFGHFPIFPQFLSDWLCRCCAGKVKMCMWAFDFRSDNSSLSYAPWSSENCYFWTFPGNSTYSLNQLTWLGRVIALKSTTESFISMLNVKSATTGVYFPPCGTLVNFGTEMKFDHMKIVSCLEWKRAESFSKHVI